MSRKPETLIQRRCREHGIETPSFQVTDDNVLVWRFPPLDISPGGIVIPEDARSPHVRGILVGWGPRAADHLYSNGYEEGHIVIWKRFAGWEVNDRTPESRRGNNYLFIKASDILGSDDLGEAIRTGKAKYIRGDDGRHTLQKKLLTGRQEKLLALAADPSTTPAERATARRLAKEAG